MTTHKRVNRFAGASQRDTEEPVIAGTPHGRTKRKQEKERQSTTLQRYPLRPSGRARYTLERFFENCSPQTEALLRKAWAGGDQLMSSRVPVDGLPCVLLLASYARSYDVHIVDDWEALLDRYEEYQGEFSHNDKFFGSCILILSRRGQEPEEASFESINIPALYEELFP